MTNFIPIFPLEIVVFPGEQLNLHIFEPRYRQLVKECFEQKKPFGIPAVIDKHLKDYGSLIYINEISNVYANGEMDIMTKADRVFRVLEVIKEVPDKLYSGAIVNYPDNVQRGNEELMLSLIEKMRALHAHLKLSKDFYKPDAALTTYDVAHHCGLTIQQEYEFLQLTHESQRQQYLKRHFEQMAPMLAQMQQLSERIQLNGHFKNLEGFEI